MNGSTRKRGRGKNPWTALWHETDPETEKRQQKSRSGFRTQKDAQNFLHETLPQVHDGSYVEPSRQLFGEYLVEWVGGLAATDLRELTVNQYRSLIRRYVTGRDLATVPLMKLGPAQIERADAELVTAGRSLATRRQFRAMLGRALTDATRVRLIGHNPARDARPVPRATPKHLALTQTELLRFLETVADDRLAALWRLCAVTGMRVGELLGLPWRTLNLDAATVEVEQQLLPTPGVTFGPPKTEHKHPIPLDATTVEILRRHLDCQTVDKAIAGDAYEDHDLVFCDEVGQPLRHQRLRERFDAARDAARLPANATPHTLRHSFATIAINDQGISPKLVAAVLGDNVATVMTTYVNETDEAMERAAASFADVLAPR
jgi:integrase